MRRLIALFIISLFASSTMAQGFDINLLLDKTWTITETYVGEMKVPTTEQDNHTTFGSDHQVVAYNEGWVEKSKWTYDPDNQTLTLSSDTTTETSEMKIHSLTTEEFKYDVATTEGMVVTIVMKPKK